MRLALQGSRAPRPVSPWHDTWQGMPRARTRSALRPSSQYRQSNVQILPVVGMRFTPSDTPSRRLWTGPYTGPG